MTPHSRARGALIGLAVGDALGTTLEFQPKNTDPHREMVTDIIGGGPFHLPAGYYTDDTAMAYALGDSLRRFGYNPRRQAEAYVAWMRHGKYDSTGNVSTSAIRCATRCCALSKPATLTPAVLTRTPRATVR